MSSPIPFSKRLRVEEIANYAQLPENLLMDIRDLSNEFFEQSSWMKQCEYSFDEIVSEILMYISTDELADAGLQAFREGMLVIHNPGNEIETEDGVILTNAAVKMGEGLLKQMRRLKLYTPEGLFPYIPAQNSGPITLHLEKYAPGKYADGIPRLDPNRLHHTRGVYPSGDYKDNQVKAKDLNYHIWYNKFWRPGRALFVDGVCFNRGIGVNAETLKRISAELLANPVKLSRCSAPYW